jgi:DNA mismatch endonuclease, patch repair protein
LPSRSGLERVMDRISKERRSWNMSRIRACDTEPELVVRSLAHRLGLRFRLHRRNLPGKPDLVFPKFKTVVFVHGCFWHRHRHCCLAYSPKTNSAFWNAKFAQNKARDRRVRKELKLLGWRVLSVWECQTRHPLRLRSTLRKMFSVK